MLDCSGRSHLHTIVIAGLPPLRPHGKAKGCGWMLPRAIEPPASGAFDVARHGVAYQGSSRSQRRGQGLLAAGGTVAGQDGVV
jgi:hypothetical protein